MENKKIKVLLFNPLVTAGGISKILSDYINNYSNNIDVEMMTFKIKNSIYFDLSKLKTYELGSSKFFLKRIIKEYKIMKKNKYDVVHINGDYCSRTIECLAAKLAGVKKIIIHSHNTRSGNNNVVKRVIHIMFKKLFDIIATDYFACSDEAAKWMFSRKIYKRKKYHFIKNGIDINKVKYNEDIRNKLRNEYNLNNKFVVGHIGRFQYQKNHSFLIDVFYEIQKQKKDSILLLIGTGELEQGIRDKVEQLNISDKVIFLGNRSDAYNFYNAMDCFVLPSFFEGLPIVLVESQTSGLPSFVSGPISDNANISKRFIKINEFDLNLWVDTILNTNNEDRINAYNSTKENGYDIVSVTKEIENLYIR